MVTKIIINGAQGKMGVLACQAIQTQPEFALVARLSRQDDLRAAIRATGAHIVVDLTRADSVYTNSLAIIESGACPVIGTSGLLDEQLLTLKNLCVAKQLGGIVAPNFSIAAVLMMRFAAQAAHFMSEVEIVETHHQQKFDAPSGTAMKTAEMIAYSKQQAKNDLTIHELLPGARGSSHHGVNIHSLRLPGVIAKQEVIFGNIGETLTITHNSIDRASFMPGIILCCHKVQTLQSLHYGLENVIGI